MEDIDLKTIFLFNSLMMSAVGIAMLNYSRTQKTYPGFKYWTTAACMVGISYLIVGLRDNIPYFFSIGITNVILSLSWLFVKNGLEIFFTSKQNSKLDYSLLFIFTLFLFYYLEINPNSNSRVAIISTYHAYLIFSSAVVVFRGSVKLFGKTNIILTTLLISLGTLSLLLASTNFFTTEIITNFMKTGGINSVILLIAYTLSVMLYFNLISINSDMTSSELITCKQEINRLAGLLPICSHCKKIRDDKGYWNNLESYIEKHSDASFSHGVCEQCSDKIYGSEDWYIEMKKKKGYSLK